MTEPGDPRQSPNLETHKKDRLSNLDLQEDGDLFYVWRMRAFVLLDSCCVTGEMWYAECITNARQSNVQTTEQHFEKNIAPL